jgi:hypothetical protein
MKKHIQYLLLILAISIVYKSVEAQKGKTFAIGVNLTNFSDWEKRPINFFNPEIIFIQELSESKKILFAFDVFYGEFPRTQKTQVGSVIDRLNFNFKTNYLISNKNSSVGIGPAFRFRNEKRILYFYPPINPFEAVIDPKKSHFDIGLNANFVQNIKITSKSKLLIKIGYTLHNKGNNPLNCGFFYGWSW